MLTDDVRLQNVTLTWLEFQNHGRLRTFFEGEANWFGSKLAGK